MLPGTSMSKRFLFLERDSTQELYKAVLRRSLLFLYNIGENLLLSEEEKGPDSSV